MQGSSASTAPEATPSRPAALRSARAGGLRNAALELHKALLDAQRVRYERGQGQFGSSGRFLELVLRHPTFEWLRALSALIARLDALEEDLAREEFTVIEDALRSLIHPEGRNRSFTAPYWVLVEAVPDVLVAHVKLWQLLNAR